MEETRMGFEDKRGSEIAMENITTTSEELNPVSMGAAQCEFTGGSSQRITQWWAPSLPSPSKKKKENCAGTTRGPDERRNRNTTTKEGALHNGQAPPGEQEEFRSRVKNQKEGQTSISTALTAAKVPLRQRKASHRT